MSDYINRDTLIDYLLKLIDVERKQGSDVMNYGRERINQTDAILAYVENMPHADVVECGECKHLGYCSRSVKVDSPLLGEYDEDRAIRYHLECCSFGERRDDE